MYVCKGRNGASKIYDIFTTFFFQILQLLVLSQHFIADTCDLYISFDFYRVMKIYFGRI